MARRSLVPPGLVTLREAARRLGWDLPRVRRQLLLNPALCVRPTGLPKQLGGRFMREMDITNLEEGMTIREILEQQRATMTPAEGGAGASGDEPDLFAGTAPVEAPPLTMEFYSVPQCADILGGDRETILAFCEESPGFGFLQNGRWLIGRSHVERLRGGEHPARIAASPSCVPPSAVDPEPARKAARRAPVALPVEDLPEAIPQSAAAQASLERLDPPSPAFAPVDNKTESRQPEPAPVTGSPSAAPQGLVEAGALTVPGAAENAPAASAGPAVGLPEDDGDAFGEVQQLFH
jgi:hypothetical protein